MKSFKKITTLALLCSAAAGAHAEKMMNVEFSGSFYATSERTISLGGEKSAFIYSVLGAGILTHDGGKKLKLSMECLGFDELGNKSGTEGVGRCTWKDSDNDQIFVAVSTHGESNRYTLLGGSGKWLGAVGKIDSKFTYLPAPTAAEFLGTDEGIGRISVPK